MFTVEKKDINFGKRMLQEQTSDSFFNKLISQSPLFGKIIKDETKKVSDFYKENSKVGIKNRKNLYFSTTFYFLSIFWSANSKTFPNIKSDFVSMLKERAKEPDFLAEAEKEIVQKIDWGGNEQLVLKYLDQIKGFEPFVKNSIFYVLWVFVETIRKEAESAIIEAEKILKIGS